MKSKTLFDQYSTIPLIDVGNSYMKISSKAAEVMGLTKASKVLFQDGCIANINGTIEIKGTAFKAQYDEKYKHLFVFCENLPKRIDINEGLYMLGEVDHENGIDYYLVRSLEIS